MDTLISTINQLQDVLHTLGEEELVELPQIVVVGSQVSLFLVLHGAFLHSLFANRAVERALSLKISWAKTSCLVEPAL